MIDDDSLGAPSGTGSRPSGRASKAVSPVPASIPSAAKTVIWRANKKVRGWTAKQSRYRSVEVALGRTKNRGRTWAVTFKGRTQTRALAIGADTMSALIDLVGRIEREEAASKAGWEVVSGQSWKAVTLQASGMEAPSGGETAKTGSTEGDSPAPKGRRPTQGRSTGNRL